MSYCYHVSKHIGTLNDINDDNLYDANIISPYDKAATITTPDRTEKFVEQLKACGLTEIKPLEDFEKHPGWEIKTPGKTELDTVKSAYFQEKFEKVKSAAANLTMDDFINPDTQGMLAFKSAMNMLGSNMMAIDDCLGLSFKRLDMFIQTLDPDTTYYLSGHYVRMDV